MHYVDSAIGSAYIPKILGIYERELQPIIEVLCREECPTIVDIGAAEGYYAIGLAVRNPRARIYAFETNEQGRLSLEHMARLNGVGDRISIRGTCGPNDLKMLLEVEELPLTIICDTEGNEDGLLDPQLTPALNKASILVETHDFLRPGITAEIQRRFEMTHNIILIWQQSRSRADFPWRTLIMTLLPPKYIDWAVSEWRPVKMCWLWMKPRNDRC